MEAPPPRVAAFFSLKILLSRHRFIEKLLAGLQGAQSGGLTGLLNVRIHQEADDYCFGLLYPYAILPNYSTPTEFFPIPIFPPSNIFPSFQGLVLPRSQAVLFSGNAMQPTINALPQHAQDKPDAHKEVLIVRSLNHIFAEHKKFHFLFPDFATRALEEELEKNPESERLLSIKESKFMHIFRPVNPGDIVLMKSPMGAAGASGRGLAAESAAGSDASTAPAADGDAAAASSAQDAYLVRRVAAVQGQELVASSGVRFFFFFYLAVRGCKWCSRGFVFHALDSHARGTFEGSFCTCNNYFDLP